MDQRKSVLVNLQINLQITNFFKWQNWRAGNSLTKDTNCIATIPDGVGQVKVPISQGAYTRKFIKQENQLKMCIHPHTRI